MNTWYQELTKPYLTPPTWVFGPAWTILYIMIAIAITMYYSASGKQQVLLTTIILIVHIVANFSWTPLFFGAQIPCSLCLILLFWT